MIGCNLKVPGDASGDEALICSLFFGPAEKGSYPWPSSRKSGAFEDMARLDHGRLAVCKYGRIESSTLWRRLYLRLLGFVSSAQNTLFFFFNLFGRDKLLL